MAATPSEICRDLNDNGRIDGTYTQQDFIAYMDAWQHDPQLQGYCPAVIVPPPPETTTVGTTTTVNTTTVNTTTVQNTTTNVTTAVVAGTTTTRSGGGAPTTTAAVEGEQKTKAQPVARQAAPLSTTRQTGTLPFTGAELAVFAVVGAALLGGGLLLRLTTRPSRSRP